MDDNLNSRAQRDSDGTPLRIFLVEDSEDVRDLIVESLSEIAGVRLVGYAETELEALRHLQQNSYDVLILDIQLKQGNGMSLLQSLARSNTRRQSEVKVVFSNHVSPTYRRVGVQCGVQHFLTSRPNCRCCVTCWKSWHRRERASWGVPHRATIRRRRGRPRRAECKIFCCIMWCSYPACRQGSSARP